MFAEKTSSRTYKITNHALIMCHNYYLSYILVESMVHTVTYWQPFLNIIHHLFFIVTLIIWSDPLMVSLCLTRNLSSDN